MTIIQTVLPILNLFYLIHAQHARYMCMQMVDGSTGETVSPQTVNEQSRRQSMLDVTVVAPAVSMLTCRLCSSNGIAFCRI